jgi:hypothetical protein
LYPSEAVILHFVQSRLQVVWKEREEFDDPDDLGYLATSACADVELVDKVGELVGMEGFAFELTEMGEHVV